MLVGAIDIGSNAVRFLVSSEINGADSSILNRVEYLRYPLRLGEDVFAGKPISNAKVDKFIQLMQSFKALFEVFEVEGYMACATSAMRNASNGTEVAKKIKDTCGVEIEIISGEREAALLFKALVAFLDHKYYLHIDVGGGSTEVNIFHQKKIIAGKSFEIGTIRAVQGTQNTAAWSKIEQWAKNTLLLMPKQDLITVGTGGNIRKLYELCEPQADNPVLISKLNTVRDVLDGMSIDDRMYSLRLNRDRADVIVHAADIYLKLMHWFNSTSFIGPQIGLIDGIAAEALEKLKTARG